MSIIHDMIHGENFGGIALDSFDEEIEIDSALFDADSVRLDNIPPKKPPEKQERSSTPSNSNRSLAPKPDKDHQKKSPGRGRPPGLKNNKKKKSESVKQQKPVKRTKRPPKSPPMPSCSSSSSDSSDEETVRVPKLPQSSGIMDLTAPDTPVILPHTPATKPAKRSKKEEKKPSTPLPTPAASSSASLVPAYNAKSNPNLKLSEVLSEVSAPGLLSPITSHELLPIVDAKKVKPSDDKLTGLTFVNSKPSIMVHLDLSLLGKHAAKVRQRAEAPPFSSSPSTLKVPPYNRDSSIEEGEDVSPSSSSSSEDEMEEKPSTPVMSSAQEAAPEREAISRSEKRRKNEQILSQIMKSEPESQLPPKQVKIPKRSRTDSNRSSSSAKRAKRSNRDSERDRSRSRSSLRANSPDRE
jgi:hypothetical protein